MDVRVRLFAGLRALAGGDELRLDLPAGATVAALRDRMALDYPALISFLPTLVCAVDEEVVDQAHILREGEVVDLVPPISGGARPVVLFLCVHNAGRSQMAAAFAERLGEGRVDVRHGGSSPAPAVHQDVVEAMREAGIDLAGARPRAFGDGDVAAADVIVTMGCGDACPYVPGKRYDDWPVDDPAGRPLAEVRAIRDDIERRVRALLAELGVVRAGA